MFIRIQYHDTSCVSEPLSNKSLRSLHPGILRQHLNGIVTEFNPHAIVFSIVFYTCIPHTLLFLVHI